MRKTLNLLVNVCVIVFVLLSETSCVSQKKLAYMREAAPEMADSINQNFTSQREAHIVCGDRLQIIFNAMDVEAVHAFNLPLSTYLSSSTTQIASSSGMIQPYVVDFDGNIQLPVLGSWHVEGMTLSQLRDSLTQEVSKSIMNPVVTVRLQNFTVTVLGEVKNPGLYTITDERVTLLEALGRAGDLTVYGKRNNILITRETNGKLEFARLNLNDASVFASPFYYLQQNDVVYVEPNGVRAIQSQNISLYLSMITTLGSMATVIVSVVNATTR